MLQQYIDQGWQLSPVVTSGWKLVLAMS